MSAAPRVPRHHPLRLVQDAANEEGDDPRSRWERYPVLRAGVVIAIALAAFAAIVSLRFL
jgi:hypothetical protein